MIQKFKKTLFFASLTCLLPIPVGIVLWQRFPESAITGTWIVIIPVAMLLAMWLCVGLSSLDRSNRDRNEKVHKLVLWIMPLLSCMFSGLMYALLLGVKFSPTAYVMAPMGVLFCLIGNYLPKTRMNATIGIKIRWTYSSEDNWNTTHRFAGKLWVVCGLVIVLGAFLPQPLGIGVMLTSFAVMTAAPILCSYRFYQQEKAEGKPLQAPVYPLAMSPRAKKMSAVLIAALVIFLVLVMFTGTLTYQLNEKALTVEADWYSDLTISYASIDALEYREGSVPGYRVGGFASARLLMGFFENEELGVYTRYTPTKYESCILITRGNNTVVLSAGSAEDTHALYRALQEKLDN